MGRGRGGGKGEELRNQCGRDLVMRGGSRVCVRVWMKGLRWGLGSCGWVGRGGESFGEMGALGGEVRGAVASHRDINNKTCLHAIEL